MGVALAETDARLLRAHRVAREQGDVLARPQLYACGITRWEVRGELAARRWRCLSDQVICLHNGPLTPSGEHWAAVLQGGPRACLDGVSALHAAGLTRFEIDRIRVSVPRGVPVRRTKRVNVRQTRRWSEDDIVTDGIRRSRPAVAAIRGALWARTDREATYLLAAVVQQGLASPEELGRQLLRIKRDRRRGLLSEVVNDLLDGARALGEIDFAKECRRRRLPQPDRQVLRKDNRNRYFLDVYWDDFDLVVEIDGIHHAWAENIVGDALRQNALTITKQTVLRLPLLGLRLDADAFFEQIREAMAVAVAAA